MFRPIVANLLEHGDYYMNLADLRSFMTAQERVDRAYRNQDSWSRMALLNIARTGRFSSDRTIAEYARDIWKVQPVDVMAAAAKHARGA